MKVSREDLIRVLAAIAPDPVLGAVPMNAVDYVQARLVGEGARWRPAIEDGICQLAGAARDLSDEGVNSLIASIADEDWFVTLARWVAESIYANPANGGNPETTAWKEIGYRHGLPEGPDGPSPKSLMNEPFRDLADHYDAIVVGAGAGVVLLPRKWPGLAVRCCWSSGDGGSIIATAVIVTTCAITDTRFTVTTPAPTATTGCECSSDLMGQR